MRSILEEFAYGNVSPEVHSFKWTPEYRQALKDLSDSEEKLMKRLNDEEKILFEEFLGAQGKVDCQAAVGNLVYGYKLGVVMTAEVFVKSGELIVG